MENNDNINEESLIPTHGNDVKEPPLQRKKRLQSFYRYLDEVEIEEEEKISVSQDLPNVSELQQKLKENEDAKQLAARHFEKSVAALEAKRRELEVLVRKHLETIDQLMGEKLKLTTRVDELLGQLENRERRFESTCKAMAARHVEELRKAKEMMLAGEKNRREEFINAERRKIRESTVNSIQQELFAIETKNSQLLEELKLVHEAKLQNVEARCKKQTADQLETQKRELLEHHNVLLEKRINECVKQHEETLDQQKRMFIEQRESWIDTIETTKLDCRKRIKECTTQLEQDRDKILKEKIQFASCLEQEYQVKVETIAKCRNSEIEIVRKNAQEQMSRIIAEKERTIKQLAIQERDMEIENVIQQFAEDLECVHKTNTLNIVALEEKHKREIEELNDKLENSKNMMKKEIDAKVQSDIKLSAIHQQMETYTEELAHLTAKNAALKKKIVELDKQHADDFEALRSRVKHTIQRKDDKNSDMQSEITALQEKLKDLSTAIDDTNKY